MTYQDQLDWLNQRKDVYFALLDDSKSIRIVRLLNWTTGKKIITDKKGYFSWRTFSFIPDHLEEIDTIEEVQIETPSNSKGIWISYQHFIKNCTHMDGKFSMLFTQILAMQKQEDLIIDSDFRVRGTKKTDNRL